ncbi:hypothetical protein DFP72DRAFT_1176408 [Ephemerocybe angulata]|uniref:Ion transport domain-containing protein n=1 Tax=Ephemerocybe angulata TaxID=980116 RepID=A0A8H6LYI7_9AGAR|nr:hypothetical protein DFP72DRAFT_1176408 [Tulosesus angulatus]
MAVGSPSSSTHSLLTQPGRTHHRPAPLDTSKFTTESPRPTPRDLYSLFPPHGQVDDNSSPPVKTFYGIIDLLSVLPYYIELMLGQDTSVLFRFSILHMFRLLRVFRPFRYNHTILLTIKVMYLSVRQSQHALLAIGFFVVMILTVFSTLLYFAERGTWDELNSRLRWPSNIGTHEDDVRSFASDTPSPTPSRLDLALQDDSPDASNPNRSQDTKLVPIAPPHGLPLTLLHPPITTVGYGGITPRSFLGRLITLPILVFGLLLITLPSFVLGREFSLVWAAMTEDKDNRTNPNSTDDLPGTTYPSAPQPFGASSSSSWRPHTSTHPPSSSTSDPQHIRASSYDPFLNTPAPAPSTAIARDLSNLKLAQNQTELSRQIAELAEEVGRQGRLLGRLVEVLGEGVLRGEGRDGLKGRGKRREGGYQDEDEG